MWLCVSSGRNGPFVGIKLFRYILHVDRDYSYTIFNTLHFYELRTDKRGKFTRDNAVNEKDA